MNRKGIDVLIEKYLKGTSSHEENSWVEKWLDSRSEFSNWSWKDDNHKEEIQQEIFDNIDDKIIRTLPRENKRRVYRYQRAVAALLIISLTFGFWIINENRKETELVDLTIAVTPGTKAATLQMGNGEVIYLDDREEGLLRQLDNVEITKEAGGSIHYNASEAVASHRIVENTLFIPRGGQYRITLPDGTTVWLNSETKLIFPTRFVGKERKVKLIGEAYFEVAKNLNQPFIVESGGMEILVTGTEFNVSAYDGASESITTLIEGSVDIHNGKENIRLTPGQQAFQSAGSMEIRKRKVDVNAIISWKKGYFSFDYQSLEEVMNEVSRWYDIEYTIVGKAKKVEKLGGTFSRDKSLDEFLNYLELLVDVKINREERRVILMH